MGQTADDVAETGRPHGSPMVAEPISPSPIGSDDFFDHERFVAGT